MDQILYFNVIWFNRWINTVFFTQTIFGARTFKTIKKIYRIGTGARRSVNKTKLRNEVLRKAFLARREVSRMETDTEIELRREKI